MNETASTLVAQWVRGSHEFTINGYSLTKKMGSIYSDTFTVGGYDWKIMYSAEANGEINLHLTIGSSVSNYLCVKFTIGLVDSNNALSQYVTHDSRFSTRSVEGSHPFMRQSELDPSPYLKNDCIRIKCVMDVLISTITNNSNNDEDDDDGGDYSLLFPENNLSGHLYKLLESKNAADVSFEVQGESFEAHRCVLAARSTVFDAELLGSMSERNTQCIKIDDMGAETFKELLRYIYTDSVPSFSELVGGDVVLMAQHLLVAADRYALERLKLICEDKLCKTISVEIVATTLVLAEQHNCGRLKVACLEFVGTQENLVGMMLTDGFEHLKMSCPSVLKELREKLPKSTMLRRVLEKQNFASVSK